MSRPVLAYVVNSLNAGGTERLVVQMSLAFACEFRVRVFCLDEPGLWSSELREKGIPVSCLWRQPGFDLRLVVRLARAMRVCGADIVHAHQCTAWFYAALARMLYPRPRLLLEEHGRFFPEVDSWLRRLVGRVLLQRLTQRFVAVSGDVRVRLGRYEGLDVSRIQVVYNGVVSRPPLSTTERAIMRRSLGFGPGDFVVGTVGRFDPIKNLPMLVRSLAGCVDRNQTVKGLLVGDGPEFAPVSALIESLGLSSRFRLTGFRADACKLAECMDLFVLSSFSEGISMALLEAVAAGVPVAVTTVGGNTEVVAAGQTGWVVASEAVEALAEVILEAAANQALRQRFKEAGRQRFEERFGFEKMISAYRDLYRSLVPMPA